VTQTDTLQAHFSQNLRVSTAELRRGGGL